MQTFLNGLNDLSSIDSSYSLSSDLKNSTEDDLEEYAQIQTFGFFTALPQALQRIYDESDLLLREKKINFLNRFIIDGCRFNNFNTSCPSTKRVFVRIKQESLELAVKNNDSGLAISIIRASLSVSTVSSNIFQFIEPAQTKFLQDILSAINEKDGLATQSPTSFTNEIKVNIHFALKKWLYIDQFPARLDAVLKNFPASFNPNNLFIYLNSSMNICNSNNVSVLLKYIPANNDSVFKIGSDFTLNSLSVNSIQSDDTIKIFNYLREHFSHNTNDESSMLLDRLAAFFSFIVDANKLDIIKDMLNEIPLVKDGRFIERLSPSAQECLLSLRSVEALDILLEEQHFDFIESADLQIEHEVSTFSL